MKPSRRGVLAGLLASGAAGDAFATSERPPELPRERFIKGMILPRTHHHIAPQMPWLSNSPSVAVAVIVYEIYDGEKFVPLESEAGQRVVKELS